MKINELREMIEKGETEKTMELLEEFYSVTRGFSQLIQIDAKNSRLVSKDSVSTFDYMAQYKNSVQEWGGGS
ncbi:hypothetical protein [Vibrio alfacsensis]|uniref:hypothetical protein n=1 Tax=Vibrio alfacsensis TaxID=1074311 RepID=UPI004067C81C